MLVDIPAWNFSRRTWFFARNFTARVARGVNARWILRHVTSDAGFQPPSTCASHPSSGPRHRPAVPLSHQTRIYPRNCCAPARFWSSLSISQATLRAHRDENWVTWVIDRDRDHIKTRMLKRLCCGSVKLNAINYRSFRLLELPLMKLKAILSLKRIN